MSDFVVVSTAVTDDIKLANGKTIAGISAVQEFMRSAAYAYGQSLLYWLLALVKSLREITVAGSLITHVKWTDCL